MALSTVQGNLKLSSFNTNPGNDQKGLGAKSQILSSVAHPRKKNLFNVFSQGHVLGFYKPMCY